MDKTTNQELFKQALVEGVNRRIDRELASCEEEAVFSRKHIKAMSRIIKGKTPIKPINKKMIAILVAAAILLASCAIIYRDEIRDFITDVKEFFVKITFDEGDNFSQTIEEIYELRYVPEGYNLVSQIGHRIIESLYTDSNGNKIKFIQQPLDNSSFFADIEHGCESFDVIENHYIYYRKSEEFNYYIWNDGIYALQLVSSKQLSKEDLIYIISGLSIK